jgi:hypothetical protein
MTTDKPLSATELREVLRLLAAELDALGVPPVVLLGADRLEDPADAKRRDEQMSAYCRTLGALQAIIPDAAGMTDPWSQRWALRELRKRAADRAVTQRAAQSEEATVP